MALPLLVALVLIAGATQNGITPEMSLPKIDISEIIANLPGLISDIDWAAVLEVIQNAIQNIPNIIDALPDIIASLPDIIANLPINIPELIATIIDRLPDIIASLPGNLPDTIGNIIASIPGIIDSLPDIIASIPDIVNLPDVIASLSALLDRIRELVGQTDWDAIVGALPDIDWSDVVASIPDIISNIPDIIDNLPAIIENLPSIIGNLPVDWPTIIDALPSLDRDLGEVASIQEFPSLVQVEFGIGNLWLQGCTGSILTTAHILTAARCFSGRLYRPSARRIIAGANTRGGVGDAYQVGYAVVHPTFGSNGFDGDIAVVRTLGVIYYGPNVQRIGITSQGVFFPAGVRLTTAGWGSTAQGRNIANRDLYKADLNVVDNWQCTSQYANYPVSITVTHNMICAGRPRSGGRMGDLRDAGGPLYYDGTLVGVLSFGRYVGNDSMPVVATSVSSYTNWIVTTAV